jgi:nucleoside-diphosphate-sugar epimerase
MRILVMGGTRFIGVYLTEKLLAQGHEVTLFSRGKRPIPANVQHIQGDRTQPQDLAQLAGHPFDAVFDNNGRELGDTQPLVELFKGRISQFIYMSSAGVYRKTHQMPHIEGDPVDPNSRHKGKHLTEAYLAAQAIPFTAIRPVYIYGPQNYNDVEAWFFDRIVHHRPIPIPGHGQHLTQLGHVEDLAEAMVQVLGNSRAIGQIYNISGDRYVSFDGLALACSEAAGQGEPPVVHYDPAQFDFGKRKAFPLRAQHFFASTQKAQQDLNWQPRYDLVAGLRDSFERDYQQGDRPAIDFSTDDEILAAAP